MFIFLSVCSRMYSKICNIGFQFIQTVVFDGFRFLDICHKRIDRGRMTVMRDISLKDRHDIDPERVVNKLQEFQFDPVLSEYIQLPQILRIVECFTGRDITATHTMLINKVILRKIPDLRLIFVVWKFCGKAQFPQSFRRFTRNSTETLLFCKFSTPGNQVKIRYFTKCNVFNSTQHILHILLVFIVKAQIFKCSLVC